MSDRPPSPTPVPEPNVGTDNITQGHLDGLTAQIQQLQADANARRREYVACRRQRLLNRLGLIYLVSARFVRTRALPFLGFRWAVIASGTTLTWAAFSMISLSLVVGLFGALFGIILFSCLLHIPGNDGLGIAIAGNEIRGQELSRQRMGLLAFALQAKTDLAALQQRHSQWQAMLEERLHRESIQRRRQELATSDWKGLQGDDFQKFLADAFRLLDYEVEETGQSGDHGVDLIVKRQANRIAVQAKGYASGNTVDNKAVQEVYSGRDIWQCHACAVITNSRYTRQAIEDAARLGCVMIDELTLQALLVGQRDLWQECIAAEPVGPQPLPNQNRSTC